MARIAEEEIERLKKEISVERLATAKGVKLKAHGENLVGLCPFHEDRSPSLVITPAKNLWHCLGACQAGGSVIDWVMRAEGVSFRYAVELLRSDLSSVEAFPTKKHGRQTAPVPVKSTTAKLPPVVDRSVGDDVLLRQVVDYYHATLKESPEALAYLQKRGLVSGEMIDRFKLGFANRTLAYRLPPKMRKDGSELRRRLQALGILRESGHEHMTGSLVIPVLDAQGRVTEMYGRKINHHLREGTPMHLYLPGPHEGVWNLEALSASKEIILCEALIDALTFWCAGFRNVTASYGVEGFTEDHLAAMRAHGTERILIAYDRDEAGDRAADKLATKLTEAGIECFRVLFPKGMDANEYALKMSPAAKALELVLRHAQWMGKGPPPAAPLVTMGATAAMASETEETPRPEMPAAETSPAAERAAEPDEGTRIVVRTETATIVVDADGVIVEEIAHAAAPEACAPPVEAPAPSLESVPPVAVTPVIAAAEREAIPPLAALSSPSPRPPPVAVREPPAEAPLTPPPKTTAGTAATAAMMRGDVTVRFGDRSWRVRGLGKNTAPELLRVNVLVSREGAGFHVDALDLYSARQRAIYTTMAASELGVDEQVIKRDLGELLLKLEELRDKSAAKKEEPSRPKLTDEEQAAALELLRDPCLLDRILEDFDRCGVVGERTNKLVGYLAATSRLLDEPLAVVIQSSSAAGKSSLMDAILNMVPEEERTQYSAMTGQSLFYLGEEDIRHKILAIVEEQGAESASYALKLLQSEGELTIASTGKDAATGRLVTQQYRVEGPVMIMLTTTAIEVDEELLNRCIVLTVDERREQTRAIHARQRAAQTLSGVLARRDKDAIVKVHRDAQRMLRPMLVVNPFAERLSFLDHATRTRRDHMKYLTLMRTIALVQQYQRPTKTVMHRGQALAYIEVTAGDIALANRLCHEVLGRSLDELPPQTRRLLGLLEEMVHEACRKAGIARQDYRFTRREVREHTRWGNTQVKVHMGRLLEMEYVVVHRGRQGQGYVYELAYAGEGKDGAAFLPGLIDVDALETAARTTTTSRGVEGYVAGSSRPSVGAESGPGRGAANGTSVRENGSRREPHGDDDAPGRPRASPFANGSYAEAVAARGA